MKAKVIATGEIIDVLYSGSGIYLAAYKRHKQYSLEELEILEDYKESNIDWEQRRFELVKAAFCGLNANTDDEVMRMDKYTIATLCVEYADAVIAKLKEGYE